MKLSICYLLETTELSGGVRVVFDQVRSLIERGHHVTLRALRGSHDWYSYPIKVDYVSAFHDAKETIQFDIVVATFWTTVDPALGFGAPVVIHLCQGCEWKFPEYASDHQAIAEVYRYPLAKMTVGDWLAQEIREHIGENLFPIANIGQSVDTELYRPPGLLNNIRRYNQRKHLPTILIVGIYESWFKGVSTALDAVAILRKEGIKIQLIRVSNLPISYAEKHHTPIDRYYQQVTPREMLNIYHQVDIFLSPSRAAEGFGLPFAEALSCGIPAVASSIPSYLSFDSDHDYAYFVREADSGEMALATKAILGNDRLARNLQRRGREVVRSQFNRHDVAKKIECFFLSQLSKH